MCGANGTKPRYIDLTGKRLGEVPVMMRDIPNEGHPGAMLSLSANGAHDGILWAAIHATGDSWHESRPGVLHAYDAEDIRHELWNSLELPERDDCGEYSKMAPPTIANGRVYLASFGTENVGSGQLCVYGLLPKSGSARPAAPAGATATLQQGSLTIAWKTVSGAREYRIERTSSHDRSASRCGAGADCAALHRRCSCARRRGNVPHLRCGPRRGK